MQTHHVDTPALVFTIKFVLVLALLVTATKIGVETIAYHILAPFDDTHLSSSQYQPRAVLDGAASIGSQLIPNASQVAAAFEQPYIDTRVPAAGKFVGVDVLGGEVQLYEDGVQVTSLPIVGMWQAGSHWEAPTGEYEIEKKETNHHSRVAAVSLPYTVHFFGNFMIHGWPYYQNGGLVPDNYEGGGIRLGSRDAQRLFRFVEIGTPIYVYNEVEQMPEWKDSLALNRASLPLVDAASYVLADLETGEVLLERNSDRIRPIASITKLMTAVTAFEMIRTNDQVPLPYKGDRYYVQDLLYPLLLRSDNSVANAMANYAGWDNFMNWMNQKAIALGMRHTSFEDPSGLSYNNRSTAIDLFRLARYLYTDTAFILAASRDADHRITSISGYPWNMTNQNRFAGDVFFVGGKLGFTDEAKKTGLSVLAVPVGDSVRVVAVVILGSSDWLTDTRNLVDWLTRAAST